MKFQHCIGALVTATAILGVLGVSEANAWGRRGPAVVPSPVYYGYGYPYYHSYVQPLPTYGVLPPPLLAYQSVYGYDPYYGTRRQGDGAVADPLDYVPRKRTSTHPAIPYSPSPESKLEDLRRARFEIHVPNEKAVVLFDGVATKQTGVTRVFVTPPLLEDKLYSSTIEVQWTDEAGTRISRRKTFDYVAGESMSHRFSE